MNITIFYQNRKISGPIVIYFTPMVSHHVRIGTNHLHVNSSESVPYRFDNAEHDDDGFNEREKYEEPPDVGKRNIARKL